MSATGLDDLDKVADNLEHPLLYKLALLNLPSSSLLRGIYWKTSLTQAERP